MQNKEMIDFRKIDLIRPTPKWLCTRTHEGCTYCKYDAPHQPNIPLDWSSEDWDGDKAKARGQCPLLHFNFLEKQVKKTLQDLIQDVSLNLLDSDTKIGKDLTKDMQALTLMGDADVRTVMDIQATSMEEPNNNNNQTVKEGNSSVPPYKMLEQELWLQKEEVKYNTYISGIGYEGDDSDLETETDTDSEGQAYPFLD